MTIEQSRLDDFLSTEELAQGAADAFPEQQADPLDQAVAETTAEVPEPPIEVAGPIDTIAGAISRRAAKAARSLPKQARGTVQEVAGVRIVNEADPVEAAAAMADQAQRTQAAQARRVRPAVLGGTSGQPAITGAPPTEPLNLDKVWGDDLSNVADADSLRAWVQTVNAASGITQPPVLTHAEVKAKAAQHGLEDVLDKALAGGMNIDVSKVYTLLEGMTAGARRLEELANKVKANPLDASAAVEFQQALALQGTLQKTVKGVQVDIARALGVFRIPRQGKDTAAIQQLLDQSGGLNDTAKLAERYLMLPTQAARNKLSERAMSTKVADLWFTTWINGLLSSPVTHARNIFGNAGFAAYQIPERAVAGLIGNLRHVFGADDYATLGDAWAHASGAAGGILDGMALAAKAFSENMPTDPVGKIESALMNQGNLGEQFNATGAWGQLLDYYGTAITLPGRALMAEDELFKAIGYRAELSVLVNRGRQQEYNRLLQAGMPDAQAKAQADAWARSALDDPSEEMDKAALQASRVATFTAPLEGNLGKLQGVLQHPLLKLYFPFVRTPANIMLETLKRTPAAFISPSFWSAVKAGGAEADMAMAKAATGSALILGIGATTLGHRVTGAGPADRGRMEVLKNQGWQPYSVVFDRADVSQAEIDQFNELTGGHVKVGPDKVYVSYAGLEPLASMLAMGATAAETAAESDDISVAEKWIFASTMAGLEYLGNQPMLAGLSRLVSDLGRGSESAKSFFVSLLNNVAKTATNFAIGGSPGGFYSSLVRGFERATNPTLSNTMAPEMDMPAPVKGFWQAIQQYRAGLPGASKGVPPGLNVWGEPSSRGFGDARDLVDPFFVSKGKFSDADAVLLALGHPIKRPNTKQEFQVDVGGMPARGRVDLSAQQFNTMIEYANEVRFGNGTVRDAIVQMYRTPAFTRLPVEKQQNMISGLYGDALAQAKQRMLAEDPDLQDRARENAAWHMDHPDTPESFFRGH